MTPMSECPGCFGEGQLDLRDMDAWFAEHMTDEQIAHAETLGFVRRVGVIDCPECEGTGVVTEGRAKDLMAAARAHVDQALAKVLAEEGRDTPPR